MGFSFQIERLCTVAQEPLADLAAVRARQGVDDTDHLLGCEAAEIGVAGSKKHPIRIAAADPDHPPVFRGGVHLSDVAHLVIEGIVIEGAPSNGLNIDDRGSFATPSHDIVLRRVIVRDCGGRGNDDGIQLSGVDDFAVERCTFVGSTAPIAYVGVDGTHVRFNTFYRPRKWFARILQETREPGFVPCRNGEFTDNLIVYAAAEVSTPINVGTETAPATFVFARNYWFCIDDPEHSIPKLPVAESSPAGGADPRFLDAEHGDFQLHKNSRAKAHGVHANPPRRIR